MSQEWIKGWVVLCPICKQWVVRQISRGMAPTPHVDSHLDQNGLDCPGSGQQAEEIEELRQGDVRPVASHGSVTWGGLRSVQSVNNG